MRFSDFLLVSDPTDLDFIVGYTEEQNIRISVADFFAGNISGSGTPGYVPVFTSAQVIGDSVIFQDGSNIVIGSEDSLDYTLAVTGSFYVSNGAVIDTTISGDEGLRVVAEDGNIFVVPNDLGQPISSLRRINHPPAVLTTESATLGQLNTAISNLEGDIELLLDLKVDKSSVGEPNGVASLDATGKIPLSEIPDSIIGQVEYMGTWNALTNTPTLNPLVPEEKGHYYVVSVAGVFGGVDYQVGDWIISNGVYWDKIDNTDAVTSVFGRIGAILALEADYQSFYPRLSQAYDNPTWINTLAFSKITDVPPFLLENQTITLSGDVTGSGKTSIASTISNNAVTDSKLRDSVGTSVIGRASSTTGDPADIQATTDGHVLLRSGGNLLFGLISSDSIGSIDWSKIINTPTTLSGYGITDAYTKVESDNKFVPYTGASANVNLGSNNITANAFVKVGGTSAQFLKADGSVDVSQYVPTTRSINAGTGLTGGGNLSSDVTLSFDTTWGDTRYAYRTRQLTINGVAYDLSADRTWTVGTVNTLTTNGTSGPATLVGNTLNIPNYTTDLSGYVTLATDQTITGLKTIVRSGDVLNFKIGTDTLYGLKLFYSQNEISPNGEATWSFVNTFNRDGVGYEVTPISFFRGVLVTGERLVTSSINTNLLDYYANNPTGRYPVYTYSTGVQQFANAIVVGETNGIVNPVSGVISDLPSGVVANFKGRVIGSNAVNSNEFVTLSQIPSLAGYVPYTGATQNVNLGEYGLSGGYFQADLSPTQASGVGRLIWNNSDGTLNLGLLGGNINLHLGQQQYTRVVNGTGSNRLRTNYQVVKIIGAQGQRVQVGLARADNDANSKDTLGLIAENINNNQEGFVISNGILEEINTTGSLQGETWNDGDTLYLSGTIYGQLTNIKPSAPIHTVIVGFVAYAHANHGKIFVKVDNGYELEELHDVNPLPYVNNGVLYRDTATNLWKSATISTILGYTPAPQGNYITALTGEATANGPGSVNITLSNSAVTGKVLTGLNVTGNAISSTDSILTAFGKLQNQVNQLVGGLMYEGTWNASTNTPTITSSVGTDGTFYIVSVAGTTNINGINDWQVGDWIVFHDTSWQKVDNSDSVSSVFGRVGNIVANQSDYSAFYPLISDIKDGILTVQGTGVLSGSGTFSANQATNNTITLTHAAVSRTDTTSAQTPSFGGSFTVVDSITSSAQGHITAINTKTVTVPSIIATSTQTGLLSNTDWTTFNSKQNAITLTTTGTSGAATLVGSTLNIPQYQAAGTYVTGVTATSPLFSSGGTTPNITIQQSGASASGFLSSTDWNTFNNKANANGSNASGAWGISITGNAATVGTIAADRIVYGGSGSRQGVTQISDWNQTAFPNAAFLSSENSTPNAPTTDFTYGVQTSFHRGAPEYRTQFVTSLYGNNVYWLRQFRDSAAWSSWVQVIHSGNFNSYAPTLTGGGASGTWGINITGSAGSAGSVDFNNLTNKSGGTGTYQTSGDFRAPIFYDSNNTGLYLDLNSTSRILNLELRNNGSFDVYEINNTSFVHVDARAEGAHAAAYKYTYSTATGTYGAYREYWWDGDSYQNIVQSGDRFTFSAPITAASDMRAPIFYDSNNTGYYLDAASTSNLYYIQMPHLGNGVANIRVNQGASENWRAIWLDGGVGNFGIGVSSAGRSVYGRASLSMHIGAAESFRVHSDGWDTVFEVNGQYGNGWFKGDARAPIFYDSNNTGYYLDPAGTNYIFKLIATNGITSGSSSHVIGANLGSSPITWNNSQLELVCTDAGNVGLSFHRAGYTATSLYHTGGSTLYTGGILESGVDFRSPIFYDSNDTSYFVNPNGQSNLYFINAPTGYVSNGNPWGTSNSAFFPNGITTAGGTNWIYGFTYIGNAPSNGAGHEFYTSGSSYSTGNMEANGSMRAPIFFDRNDTAFYVDPNSSSRVFQLDATSWLRAVNGSVIATGIGGSMTMTASTTTFGAYLRTSGHMVFDQTNTGFNVYVLDGNSVGVVKNAGSQSWSAFSDRTIKTVHSIIDNNLSKLDSITPIYYSFNNFADDKNRIGLIAQEVQEQFPELVEVEPRTQKLTLDYTGLIPVLLGAIKELKTEIETLKTKQ